jgi:hypothetical protein
MQSGICSTPCSFPECGYSFPSHTTGAHSFHPVWTGLLMLLESMLVVQTWLATQSPGETQVPSSLLTPIFTPFLPPPLPPPSSYPPPSSSQPCPSCPIISSPSLWFQPFRPCLHVWTCTPSFSLVPSLPSSPSFCSFRGLPISRASSPFCSGYFED